MNGSLLLIIVIIDGSVSFITHSLTDPNDDKYDRNVFSFSDLVQICHQFNRDWFSVIEFWFFFLRDLKLKKNKNKINHQH